MFESLGRTLGAGLFGKGTRRSTPRGEKRRSLPERGGGVRRAARAKAETHAVAQAGAPVVEDRVRATSPNGHTCSVWRLLRARPRRRVRPWARPSRRVNMADAVGMTATRVWCRAGESLAVPGHVLGRWPSAWPCTIQIGAGAAHRGGAPARCTGAWDSEWRDVE